jgi:uncharacterized protein
MSKAADTVLHWYRKLVLDHPLAVFLVVLAVVAVLGIKARDFRIDASADTLLLEHDEDLRFSREIASRYEVNDFLLIAYAPHDGRLLSDSTLAAIGRLRDELSRLPRVTSVVTLLDVPLFESPPVSVAELADGIRTLESPETDIELAARELRESPLYSNLIVSEDMRTTALIVNLQGDEAYQALIRERNRYLTLKTDGKLTPADAEALAKVQQEIARASEALSQGQSANIEAIRAIMDRYRSDADLFLGGVSMIQNDMIAFIRNDLKVFGLGVFTLLVIMLGLIFRRLLWIVLPMLCCFLSVIAMMGILALFGWEVTVISSNFISLQLIITLSIVIHLIVRYREFHRLRPNEDQRHLVNATLRTKFMPSLFSVLTTIAGFSSLVLSDIKPVINFGWMMSAGLVTSLFLTFVLFPATVMLVRKRILREEQQENRRHLMTAVMANLTRRHGTAILVIAGFLALFAVVGISRLRVENSFIDYFKESTEIYQGMELIDRQLGGTTPLDVIIQFDRIDLKQFAQPDEEEEYDPLLDPYAETREVDYDQYWFFDERLRTIRQVHDYLDALPQTGKVLSLGTLLKIGKTLNEGKPLESIEMAVLYNKIPQEYRDLILDPYISIEQSEARFSVRIKDSLPDLNRDALLRQIRAELIAETGLEPEQVRLAGMMVLYNNMLQSLFDSQIKTMGVVALALFLMFLVLFRSLRLAAIAIFPNLLSAAVVMSILGWLDIPLDMMTITIAAISVGIAVDNTIHYIHRFREEFEKGHNYEEAMQISHSNVGHAMYYTSATIIIGFSILALSNFWPTIYFGIFTGLAMLLALIAALTLLPRLIVLLKPYGQPGPPASGE